MPARQSSKVQRQPATERPTNRVFLIFKFSADTAGAQAAKPHPPTFPLIAFEDVKLDTEFRGYLIKGLLPDSGLAAYGGLPSATRASRNGCRLHVALGLEYRGRRVQQAAVVYAGLEGRHGLPRRVEAFKKHHQVERAPFYLMTRPLNLTEQVDALIADIEAQLGDVRPGVVFIDTLNRRLVGSESKDEDMAAYLAAAGKTRGDLVPRCDCPSLGIDGTRPRGHLIKRCGRGAARGEAHW